MNLLVIPIHLDALFLKNAQQVVGAKADFSRLPYFDKEKNIDINSDIANISENVLSKSFQNNLTLEVGMHLHWALPDVLTQGVQNKTNNKLEFPRVPDRWLVTRKSKRGTEQWVTKQWVVESNFLQEEWKENMENGITFPLQSDERGPTGQPYRFLGRQYDNVNGFQASNNNEYYNNLTALGYGDPTFGAFYPECHSVFGCYDDSQVELLGEIEYDVLGWYSYPQNDHLLKFINDYIKTKKPIKDINETIKTEFNVDYEISGSYPKGLICQGRLVFKDGILKGNTDVLPTVDNIAIGNTGTEALSAMLSEGNEKTEKQLEAIRLMSKIGSRRLDIHAKFEEAFHDNGFTPVPGGSLWSVNEDKSTQANNDNKSHVNISLPDSFAHKLNALNTIQQQFDRRLDEYQNLKQQLFSDWYKYMSTDYHPYIKREELADIDEIKFFIETHNFKELDRKSKELERISPLEKHMGEAWKAIEEVKAEILKFNEGRIPNEKQLHGTSGAPLSYQFKKNNSLYPDLELDFENLQWGMCQSLKTDCLIFNKEKSQLSISLNHFSKNSPFEVNELSNALANLKQIKALSMWVKISHTISTADFNLVRVEGFENSSIGPTEMSDFWKAIYINGQKLDPFTAHKWQEIPKDEWIHLYVEAKETFVDTLILMENCLQTDEPSSSIASLRIMKRGLSDEEIASDRNVFGQTKYVLDTHAGPRFWEPNEPVLLLSGSACKPSARHGFDGKENDDEKLGCFIKEVNYPLDEEGLEKLANDNSLQKAYDNEMEPFLNWTEQPWNPITLEWELEIFPLARSEERYEESTITKAFQQNDTMPDLKLKSSEPEFITEGKVYSGSTLLSPHSKIKLLDAIDSYLADPNLDQKSPIAVAARLKKDEIKINHSLSQSLGGFNAALLMHKQTLQLPIDDPLGFENYQAFTQVVKDLVDGENKWAPEPHNPFLPIRAGKIKILNLRLIDSFGRFINVDSPENLVHSHAFPKLNNQALLLPRLTQPARLNLRWLSANQNELEMNSHPANSPICGWILPNNIDNSLMIYDQAGSILGIINQKNEWRPGPGNEVKLEIDQISNKHLRQVILNLQKDTNNFISLLDQTLEKIDPESFSQHLDLAVLMGRPVAIVRASINLELKGRTAVSQSWELFARRIEYGDNGTEGFEKVRFPMRLGEPGQFNDGVLGYWKDTPEGSPFYSTLSYDTEKPNITVSVADEPQTFTMLIDPRAKVHLVSGILPTKIIDIPPDQYTKALSKIDIFFLASPVLSPVGKIALPLPAEHGYEWSWLSMHDDKWSEVSKIGKIDKHKVLAAFANGEEIWTDLILHKWIDPIDGFCANIVLKNHRKNMVLSETINSDTDKIEHLLNQCMINPPNYAASFIGSSEIREGWLKLSHKEK
jgi:hypothetical protein